MRHDVDSLRQQLDRLAGLVPEPDVAAVSELRRRLDERALRVLVAGEAKRGKSTLINALLGRDLLPTGMLPLTSIATTVRYGDPENVSVQLRGGPRREQRPLWDLAALVTESGNPDNARGVADVVVSVPSRLLAAGVELVDTPGVGSVYRHNSEQADEALDRMDAAIMVLSADPPISASERDFICRVRDGAVTVFCVLNKVDRLTAAERGEALAFTEKVLSDTFSGPVRVWPVSARSALQRATGVTDDTGNDIHGFEEFAAAFTTYLSSFGDADLVRSLANRARQLAAGVADTHAASLAALDVSRQTLTEKAAGFTATLRAVELDRRETAAVAAVAFDEMLAEVDVDAVLLAERTLPVLLADTHQHLASMTGPTGELETQALNYATGRIRQIVDEWRARQAAELDAALDALEARISQRLNGHIVAVRDAASDLFAVSLPDIAQPTALPSTREFRYRFAPDPGQIDAIAAVARHRLPARWGRRQVDRYVARRVTSLLDKHIGRARSDFQAQLADTRRLLLRTVDRRFDQGAGRIADAITTATALRDDDTRRADLAHRQAQAGIDAARQLIRDLDPLIDDVRRAADDAPVP